MPPKSATQSPSLRAGTRSAGFRQEEHMSLVTTPLHMRVSVPSTSMSPGARFLLRDFTGANYSKGRPWPVQLLWMVVSRCITMLWWCPNRLRIAVLSHDPAAAFISQGAGVKTKTVRIQHFPEVAGMAPYTTGKAEGLAAYAHDVSLVTGSPHYPEWRICAAHCSMRSYREAVNRVTIDRLRHYVPRKPSLRNRIRMEARSPEQCWPQSSTEEIGVHVWC